MISNKLSSVQKLYHIGNAQWYDFFRKVWIRIVERRLEKDFLQILNQRINTQAEIVEIGCGTGINVGRILSMQKKFKSYLGIDFSQDMLAIAKQKFGKEKRITFIEGDARTASLPKSYNLVLCTWVLSHIQEPSAVVNKVYEQLEKKGVMLLVFLTKPSWYIAFWFLLLAKYVFHSCFVPEDEIKAMKGEKDIRRYAFGLATFVVIRK